VATIHFAASIVVPDSVVNPLAITKTTWRNSRALIECAVRRRRAEIYLFVRACGVWQSSARPRLPKMTR
jgi:UDP-glucose 4-epimerase